MASIDFNDGVARTLENSAPTTLHSRFEGWLAQPIVRGPVRHELASGTRRVFEHRTDRRVSFFMQLLSAADLEVAQYLIEHLQREARTCTLNTGDTASRVYTAFLGPDDSISLNGPDPESNEYTLNATLTTTATTPPLCIY